MQRGTSLCRVRIVFSEAYEISLASLSLDGRCIELHSEAPKDTPKYPFCIPASFAITHESGPKRSSGLRGQLCRGHIAQLRAYTRKTQEVAFGTFVIGSRAG